MLTAIANTVLFPDCLFPLVTDCRDNANAIIRCVEKNHFTDDHLHAECTHTDTHEI